MSLAIYILGVLSLHLVLGFDHLSVQSKFSSILENLESLESSSKSTSRSIQSYCDCQLSKSESSISQISQQISDTSFKLSSVTMPKLMQRRFRKMDVEEKMDLNRKERSENSFLSNQVNNHVESQKQGINDLINEIQGSSVFGHLESNLNNLINLLGKHKNGFDAVDERLEALFVQFRNEYTGATPFIIDLEAEVDELNEKLGELKDELKDAEEEHQLFKDWCKVQKKELDEVINMHEIQSKSGKLFDQVLIDLDGELADYVIQRVQESLNKLNNE
ncbi:hypothetical protein SteCoe_9748 [Stentor coeruleus]|uniref:Uncharacterized protein n=1 Tax=Stentor coeruleus TaxID=5963 RepID=A0A1R2CH99_9CILI|nr:hypothetical protein SteCoe_9748 [Stentor coeruleus]